MNGAVHWTGVADGVRIEGITRDGRHLIHRPADDQPGAPAADGHRSYPLTEPAPPGTGARPATVARPTADPVEADAVSLSLRPDAGRGLPPQWTREEMIHAAARGEQIGSERRVGAELVQQVRYGDVLITVVRDWDSYRIIDFRAADGHTPPPQGSVPLPRRGSGPLPATDGEGPLLHAPHAGDADVPVLPQAYPNSDVPAPNTLLSNTPVAAAAHHTADQSGEVPPPATAPVAAAQAGQAGAARTNPWHPTATDGTVQDGPRRPPALQGDERQETLHNGTVRVFKARLDPVVEAGAPVTAFPSRWSRSLLDPGTVYYPKTWTAAHLGERVTEALGNTLFTRVENGVTFKLGRADGVWIEGMYLADGSFMGHRPSPTSRSGTRGTTSARHRPSAGARRWTWPASGRSGSAAN